MAKSRSKPRIVRCSPIGEISQVRCSYLNSASRQLSSSLFCLVEWPASDYGYVVTARRKDACCIEIEGLAAAEKCPKSSVNKKQSHS
jgi:hypothetical protein